MIDETEKTNEKQDILSNSDKPWLFKKGQSGNPLGRPKGAKNKITQFLQNISEEDQIAIADRVVELAKRGHIKHLNTCLPYLIPKAKAPNAQMIDDDVDIVDLKLDTPGDIKKASEMIIKAMIAGKISVPEAQGMISIIEKYGSL